MTDTPAPTPAAAPRPPGDARLARRMLATGLALLTVVWGGVGWMLASERQAALALALQNNSHLALALSEQVSRVLESVRGGMDRLATAAAQGPVPREAYARYAAETGLGADTLLQLSLIGPDGVFVGSNLATGGRFGQGPDLSDRPHVRAHLQPRAGDPALAGSFYVGPTALGKVSQQWSLQISQRVGPIDQPAQGVVVASLRVSTFNALFARLKSSPADLLALVGLDGRVRAVADNPLQMGLDAAWPDADSAPQAQQALRLDGHGGDYLLARQKVYLVPLQVVVATPRDEALAAWHKTAAVAVALAGLFTVLLGSALWALWRGLRRLQAQHQALADSEARATELSESRGRWLAERTAELQAAQAQLLQSEKMAAVGQLVASVAHEVNTPIAAIQATGRNIADALAQALAELPQLGGRLGDAQWPLFIALLQRPPPAGPLSTREERARVRQIAGELEAWALADAHGRALRLVQLGVDPAQLPALRPLLQADTDGRLLATAASLASIGEGSRLIDTAVQRVSKIVYSLKSVAHGGAGGSARQWAPLEPGLEHALNLYAQHFRHGVTLHKTLAAPAPLPCWPDELTQVWLNLVANALHVMPGQGTLSVHSWIEGDWHRVDVGDTGPGIPPDIRPRVFEPFFTTKPAGEGSGLGLGISRQIVERHGGRIDFETEVGAGTTFHVWLPRQATGFPFTDTPATPP